MMNRDDKPSPSFSFGDRVRMEGFGVEVEGFNATVESVHRLDRKDTPQYPQERETVGGERVEIFAERDGYLYGRCGLYSFRWLKDGGVGYTSSFNLKPLAPPEPEVVEVDVHYIIDPKGRLVNVAFGEDISACLQITGTIPKPAPGKPLVTYRAPILTPERVEAIKEGLSAAKARLPAYDKRLATLRDMLGEGE